MSTCSNDTALHSKAILRTGLYTDNRGRSVVYVIDAYRQSSGHQVVDYDNVRTGLQYKMPLKKFKKKYPNRVDKVEVSFK